MIVLYARVSTVEQTTEHQLTQAAQAGLKIDKVVADDGVSGVSISLAERPEGRRLFDMLRAGDTLVVRWVDRLGRNYAATRPHPVYPVERERPQSFDHRPRRGSDQADRLPHQGEPPGRRGGFGCVGSVGQVVAAFDPRCVRNNPLLRNLISAIPAQTISTRRL
jgi:Resolvase, N terminal domain